MNTREIANRIARSIVGSEELHIFARSMMEQSIGMPAVHLQKCLAERIEPLLNEALAAETKESTILGKTEAQATKEQLDTHARRLREQHEKIENYRTELDWARHNLSRASDYLARADAVLADVKMPAKDIDPIIVAGKKIDSAREIVMLITSSFRRSLESVDGSS